jgi:hypothetical protein
MAIATLTTNLTIGGLTVNSRAVREGETQISHDVEIPAAKTGTLSTRSDNDTGVVTLGEGHGITDADTVDVYWTGGMRYGMTVTGYDTTTITVDVGSGDNFPIATTAVIVGVRVTIDSDFDGDNVTMIAAYCAERAHVNFREEDETSILAVELTAGEAWVWLSDVGAANPLTGDPVGEIIVTQTGTSAATLKIIALVDSVE